LLKIFNTISKTDANYIAQHTTDFEQISTTSVILNSPGGDVDAAMRIGRILRKNEVFVSVADNAKCYSSCALIYIAGVNRINYGTVGLHRPYLATPQSRQDIERQFPLILKQLKLYVEEMGITDNFYQEMVNTEPSDMKSYMGDNINRLVPHIDPTYDEVQVSHQARRYGISPTEVRRRTKEADKCWSLPVRDATAYCDGATKWGLSESVYREREKERMAKCNHILDESRMLWKSLNRKERQDHPAVIQFEDCQRNIMLGR
jgi:ATP-dependent protease ClpP protease subunit